MAWTLDDLQREAAEWNDKNFGPQPAWMYLLGMVEETCDELMDAESKQNLQGIGDAIADTIVFMSGFCTAMGFDLHILHANSVKLPDRPYDGCTVAQTIGKMAHSFLKMTQNIRGSELDHRVAIVDELTTLLAALHDCASFYDFDLIDLVHQTWSEVKKRDWTKNPTTGTSDAATS